MENMENMITRVNDTSTTIKYNIFDFLYLIIGVPWIFLMIMSVRLFSDVKMYFLIALLFVLFIDFIVNVKKINKAILAFTFIFITYFFISLIIGIYSGYDFSLTRDISLIENYIALPIIVVLFGKVFNMRPYRKKALWTVIIFITFLLVFLDVIKIWFFGIGFKTNLLSFIMIADDYDTSAKLSIRLANEPCMMFLVPIFVFLLFDGSKKRISKIVLYSMIVFLGITYALISGRKMLEFIILLSLLLTLFYRFFIDESTKKNYFNNLRFIILFPIVVLLLVQFVNMFSVFSNINDILPRAIQTFVDGFSSSSHGVIKRENNASALINLWSNSPFWGNGLNSYAIDSIASSTTKWSYEVVYIALLAQTGIFGVLLFFIPLIYIVRGLIINYKNEKNSIYVGIVIGLIAFVICGSTNPLVYFIWPWMISYTFSFESGGDTL